MSTSTVGKTQVKEGPQVPQAEKGKNCYYSCWIDGTDVSQRHPFDTNVVAKYKYVI